MNNESNNNLNSNVNVEPNNNLNSNVNVEPNNNLNSNMNNEPNNNLNNNMNIGTNNNVSNNPNNSEKNNIFKKLMNKKIIIGIVVIIIIAIILVISFGKKSGITNNSNGYTAGNNETLKIDESRYKFNVKITSSLEKVNDNYARLKLSIKNLYSEPLEFNSLLVYMSLTDSTKKDILNSDYFYNSDSLANIKISNGQTEEGYIYFDSLDTNTYNYKTIDDNLLNSIEYLKITVLSSAQKTDNDKTKINFNEYYLKLK